MGKTLLTGILMHLQPEKAERLNRLAADTGIKRSVLLREAIDDLFIKYKVLKPRKRRKP